MQTQPKLKNRRRQSGFTLVEIMIVVLIIGVLLNVAAPAFIGARDKGQARACVKNLTNIMTAKEIYVMENRVPASNIADVGWPNIKGYIHSTGTASPTLGPPCPTNGQYYTVGAPAVLPVCAYGTSGANPLAVHQIQ